HEPSDGGQLDPCVWIEKEHVGCRARFPTAVAAEGEAAVPLQRHDANRQIGERGDAPILRRVVDDDNVELVLGGKRLDAPSQGVGAVVRDDDYVNACHYLTVTRGRMDASPRDPLPNSSAA